MAGRGALTLPSQTDGGVESSHTPFTVDMTRRNVNLGVLRMNSDDRLEKKINLIFKHSENIDKFPLKCGWSPVIGRV